MRVVALLTVAVLLTAACEDDPPMPEIEPPVNITEEPPPPNRCHADSPVVVHRGAEPVSGGVGISHSGDGGVVCVIEEGDLRIIPVDGEGAGRGPSTRIEDAGEAIFALSVVGDSHLAIVSHRCDGGTCLRGYFLSADGARRSRVDAEPIGAPWTTKQASHESAALIAVGHEDGPPDLVTFTTDGVTRVTLPAVPETRTEVLALAAREEAWTVLYRVGAAEGEDSQVLALSSGEEEPTEIEALHDALAVESFALTTEGVATIAAFEFSRPQFMHLGREPVLLAPGVSVPPPFEARRRVRAYQAHGRTFVDGESAAGDGIERRLQITEGAPSRDFSPGVARVGPAAFLVATVRDAGREIVTARVRCD